MKKEEDLKEKVIWFFNNLEWQLEDLAVEQQGRSVELFFDTIDVTVAALGMDAYYNEQGAFLAEGFKEERALVRCLLASGWLGEIRMLSPHQAEFLSLLNIDFGVGLDRDLKGLARRFLNDVKTMNPLEASDLSLDDLTEEELLKFVRKHAGSAMTAFKAIQCIRGTWQTRLVKWRESELLRLHPKDFNYSDLINTEFQKLKGAFDSLRGKAKSVNNFADAVAIRILIREKQRDAVPRFYDSSGTFGRALTRAGSSDLLLYRNDDGAETSILRNSSYFIFRAAFRVPLNVPSSIGTGYFSNPENLRDLRDEVAEILKAQAPFDAADVDKIQVDGRPLSQVIDELKNFSLFENVWVPFCMEEDVQSALRALGDAVDPLQSEKFQEGVEAAVKSTREELERNARAYERVNTLWNDLKASVERLHLRVPRESERPFDDFRVFGLIRFAFPETSHESVTEVLEALRSTKPKREESALRGVMATCFAELRENQADVTHKLVQVSAVLWTLGLYEHLITLLGNHEPLPHYSLNLIYGASVFESDHDLDLGFRVLHDVKKKHDQTDDLETRANLAIGLGYLYFHLWKRVGFDAPWRQYGVTPLVTEKNGPEIVNEAINYAKSAYDLLSNDHKAKKAYALNQYLYYLVEGGGDDRKQEMFDAARTLLLAEVGRKTWQYRFDDTMARYFHRLACAAKSEGDYHKWNDYIRDAKLHSEAARLSSPGDRVVDDYLSVIKTDMEEVHAAGLT